MTTRPMTIRTACTVLAAGALLSALSACVPLVVGGAVVGGMMAVDRRTAGTQVEDEGIELRAANRLREAFGERAHISVTSFNRQVLLTGEAPTEHDREQAAQIVQRVDNVKSVVNEVAVMPNTTFGQRSGDTLITSKVRASLMDAKDLFASAYKVVTERGTVYLMGRVTEREARRATEIARGVNDVRKVVRVFEIITEEELQRGARAPQPAPSAPPALQDAPPVPASAAPVSAAPAAAPAAPQVVTQPVRPQAPIVVDKSAL